MPKGKNKIRQSDIDKLEQILPDENESKKNNQFAILPDEEEPVIEEIQKDNLNNKEVNNILLEETEKKDEDESGEQEESEEIGKNRQNVVIEETKEVKIEVEGPKIQIEKDERAQKYAPSEEADENKNELTEEKPTEIQADNENITDNQPKEVKPVQPTDYEVILSDDIMIEGKQNEAKKPDSQDIEKRLREIENREKQLAEREAAVSKREEELKKSEIARKRQEIQKQKEELEKQERELEEQEKELNKGFAVKEQDEKAPEEKKVDNKKPEEEKLQEENKELQKESKDQKIQQNQEPVQEKKPEAKKPDEQKPEQKVDPEIQKKRDWYQSLGNELQKQGIDINNPFALSDVMVDSGMAIHGPKENEPQNQTEIRKEVTNLENTQKYAFMQKTNDGSYTVPRPGEKDGSNVKWMADNLQTFSSFSKDDEFIGKLYDAAQKGDLFIRSHDDKGLQVITANDNKAAITAPEDNKISERIESIANAEKAYQRKAEDNFSRLTLTNLEQIESTTKEINDLEKLREQTKTENAKKLKEFEEELKEKYKDPEPEDKKKQEEKRSSSKPDALGKNEEGQQKRSSSGPKKEEKFSEAAFSKIDSEYEERQRTERNKNYEKEKKEYEKTINEVVDELDKNIGLKKDELNKLSEEKTSLSKQFHENEFDRTENVEKKVSTIGKEHPEWLGVNQEGKKIDLNEKQKTALERTQKNMGKQFNTQSTEFISKTEEEKAIDKQHPELSDVNELAKIEQAIKKISGSKSIEEAMKGAKVTSMYGAEMGNGKNTKAFMRDIMKDLREGKPIQVDCPQKNGKIKTETLMLDKNNGLMRAANVSSYLNELNAFREDLQKTDSRFSEDSPEYQKVQENLDKTIESLEKNPNGYIKSQDMMKELKDLNQSIQNYKDTHLNENDLSNRQLDRLTVMSHMQMLSPTEQDTKSHPGINKMDKLAMKVTMGRAKSMEADPETRELGRKILSDPKYAEKMKNELMQRNDFKATFGNKNPTEMEQLLKKSPDELWKQAAKGTVAYNKKLENQAKEQLKQQALMKKASEQRQKETKELFARMDKEKAKEQEKLKKLQEKREKERKEKKEKEKKAKEKSKGKVM